MTNGRCAACRYNLPVYIGDGDELLTACVYILRTGRKRPCPAGDACSVFEPAGPDGCAGSKTIRFGKERYI